MHIVKQYSTNAHTLEKATCASHFREQNNESRCHSTPIPQLEYINAPNKDHTLTSIAPAPRGFRLTEYDLQ